MQGLYFYADTVSRLVFKFNMQKKKKATGTKTAAGSRSMKRNLDTGVEVCDNREKKNQRHTTNEKPNMYKDIYKMITNIQVCKTDLLQGGRWSVLP